MKKVNFNGLKNISTPDNWIENAINIPKEKKIIPFYLRPSVIASAVCIVFISVISVFTFTDFGSDVIIPISPVATTSVSDNNYSFPQNTQEGSQNTQNGTESYDNINLFTVPATVMINTDGTSTDNKNNKASSDMKNTENVTGSGNQSTEFETKPSFGNTNPSQSSATEPVENTNPTINIKPTQPVVTQQPATEEPVTKTPVIDKPPIDYDPGYAGFTSEPSVNELFDNKIYLILKSNSVFSTSSNIYCHIQTLDGFSYTNKYSNSELCTIISDSNFYASYRPASKNLNLFLTNYKITFYDSFGHSIERICYLGNSDYYFYE